MLRVVQRRVLRSERLYVGVPARSTVLHRRGATAALLPRGDRSVVEVSPRMGDETVTIA